MDLALPALALLVNVPALVAPLRPRKALPTSPPHAGKSSVLYRLSLFELGK